MIIKRLQQLTSKYSLFLFGPRGSGKSTLLEQLFPTESAYWISFLDAETESTYALNPNHLIEVVKALDSKTQFVVIDEVQKIPKILDIVHLLIEKHKAKQIFILTGSSARKLKAGSANLLAGRAVVYNLFPFSFCELGEQFNQSDALSWGLLPRVVLENSENLKRKILIAYANTYLKEEVWGEHLVKNLDPFRRFLEVAAQSSGKIINFAKISADVGIDDKTVKTYYQILEETLLGFFLDPYHASFRKRFSRKPKFYFVDIGISRALANQLSIPPSPSTSYYGELFEQLVIAEIYKLVHTLDLDYKLSYFTTSHGVEIDLVVERPGKKTLLIEIKSASQPHQLNLRNLKVISAEIANAEAICFSNYAQTFSSDEVTVYPWREGILKFFSHSEVHKSRK
jgi:predicted AAA+ superfamily ATPase